ncbi:MAG TPA: SDR family NAD(P)-dependent oxidoreductase [Polyangiaceae bacterium]|nr:SDR family NAD(P)-dependent oxidoreductase [Polyangiaceae bacterium]
MRDVLDLLRRVPTPKAMLTVTAAARDTAGPVGPWPTAALFRSVAQERSGFPVMGLVVSSVTETWRLAEYVHEEAADVTECDVFRDETSRSVAEWVDPAPAPAAAILRGSVVVATGGARGITAAICRELARRGAVLELCGTSERTRAEDAKRTSGDDKRAYVSERHRIAGPGVHVRGVEREWQLVKKRREVTNALLELERGGADAHYEVVDMRDPGATRRWLDRVVARRGKIDFILHGAGVLNDGIVDTKTMETVRPVLDTKLGSLRTLRDVARRQAAHFVAFSSVAAVFGSPGQSDYAAANEFMAHQTLTSEAHGRALVIAWGAWRNLGMTAGSITDRMSARRVALLEPEQATLACVHELEHGTTGHVMISGEKHESA